MRKTNLERLLRGRSDGIFVNPFETREIGPDLFHAACGMGLEGLVSKRGGSRYRGGRSKDWIKVRNRHSPALFLDSAFSSARAAHHSSKAQGHGAAPPLPDDCREEGRARDDERHSREEHRCLQPPCNQPIVTHGAPQLLDCVGGEHWLEKPNGLLTGPEGLFGAGSWRHSSLQLSSI